MSNICINLYCDIMNDLLIWEIVGFEYQTYEEKKMSGYYNILLSVENLIFISGSSNSLKTYLHFHQLIE